MEDGENLHLPREALEVSNGGSSWLEEGGLRKQGSALALRGKPGQSCAGVTVPRQREHALGGCTAHLAMANVPLCRFCHNLGKEKAMPGHIED